MYLFAEALAEGAVKMGMPSALAHSIASQTILVSIIMCVFVNVLDQLRLFSVQNYVLGVEAHCLDLYIKSQNKT